MNLYVTSQSANGDYDTYDAAVVAANNEDEARRMHPAGYDNWDGRDSSTWANVEDVTVTLIGTAVEGIKGVILASFNAG